MPGFPGAGIGTHYLDTSTPVEDVSDIIFQITPEDTPFSNMIGNTRSLSVVHQWQVRSLTTRQHNSQPEGFTYDFLSASRLPSRLDNLNQIFSQDVRVSRTQQETEHYAIGDMFGDQAEQALVEHGTDIEHTLIQGTTVSGTATDVDRQLSGIIEHLQAGSGSSTSFGGTNVTFDETALNDSVELVWDAGGEARDVFVHGTMKRRISGFTASNTQFIPADEQRTVRTISVYETDFFPVQIHLSRDIPSAGKSTIAASYSGHGLLFVDRTMLNKAWIHRTTVERVPKTADSMDGVITSELTLEVGNRNAHYYIDAAL